MIAFKRVPNSKLMFLDYFRGVDIRKGIPMMFHTNIVLNGREIREPSGHVGEGRGHSAKTYVFVFFIVQTCRCKEGDSDDVSIFCQVRERGRKQVQGRSRVEKMTQSVIENFFMILLQSCCPGKALSNDVSILCCNEIPTYFMVLGKNPYSRVNKGLSQPDLFLEKTQT